MTSLVLLLPPLSAAAEASAVAAVWPTPGTATGWCWLVTTPVGRCQAVTAQSVRRSFDHGQRVGQRPCRVGR